MNTIGFAEHDHSNCIDETLALAEARCRADKLQFTSTRRRVLELLLEQHKALGAYELLERLSREGLGSQPPVAYRALEFLVKHGFAHRIERLNAFIACTDPGCRHAPAFMICRVCHSVAEASASRNILGQAARGAGFRIERTVVEAEGVCPECFALDADA